VKLRDIESTLSGMVPVNIVTASVSGEPSVTNISQLWPVDDRHVAISRQFLNKSAANLQGNPQVTALVLDPRGLHSYRLKLKHLRTETEGPLFDKLSARINSIASIMKLEHVFKLRGAEICEVLQIDPVGQDLEA
jgi:hypothetical protein